MTPQYAESFNGGWVPVTPLPDRFPATPDDIPSRSLGECPKCGCEHHAELASAVDSIPTTTCESCGEEFCTECPMGFCEIGDHAVCKACVRHLRPARSGDPLEVCLKCTGDVLEAPLGEIYQMKRAMGFALDNICQGKPNAALGYLRASLTGAKQRGF